MSGIDMSKLGVRKGRNGEERLFLLPDFRAPGHYRSEKEETEQRDYRVETGSVEHRINTNNHYAKEETDKGETGPFPKMWSMVSGHERSKQEATQEPPDSSVLLAGAFIAKGGMIQTLPSGVGLAYAQGRRPRMEDEHIATILEISVGGETKKIPLQAVFDGHGGGTYARFAQKYYVEVLKNRLEECNPEELTDTGIYNAFSLAAADMHRLPPILRAGTTANVSLIIDNTIYIANTGDSRAILVTENDCIQLSEDAKPDNERFHPAMLNRDPEAMEKISNGRLIGLSIARTWGDHNLGVAPGLEATTYLNDGIDPRPKVTKYVMTDDERKNARLVQTCDGAYEFYEYKDEKEEEGVIKNMSSRVMGEAVRQSALAGDSAAYTASKALAAAYHAKSYDNISVMVTPLDKIEVDSTVAPAIPEELQQFLEGTKNFFDKNHPDIQKRLDDSQLNLKFRYAVLFSALLGDAGTLKSLTDARFSSAWCNEQLDTLLAMVARNGHTAAMNVLLEKKVPIDQRNDKDETALMLAIKGGHTEAVKLLVEAGAAINLKDKRGNSCMEMAVESGNADLVRLLMESEKGPTALAAQKEGVLTWAAVLGGHIDVLNLLIEKNAAHLNAPRSSKNSDTPLCEVMKTGRADIAELMIKNGADVDVKNKENQPLAVVAAMHGQTAMLELLSKQGYDIDKNGPILMAEATKHGRHGVVQFLIDRQVDVNAADDDGKTALMHAAMGGHTHLIQPLLEAGADITLKDKGGNSCMEMAVESGKADLLRLLMESEKGPAVLTDDKDGRLTWRAALGRHLDILNLLIEKKAARLDAPRNSKNSDTPLCEIVKTDRADIAKLMIKNGANPRVKNNENQSLPVVAAMHGQAEMLELLGSKGYNIAKNGRVLMAQAAKHGHPEVVQFLIDRQVDVNAADGSGRTALMYAAMGGHTDVIQLLAEHGAKISATTKEKHKSALQFARESQHAKAQELLEELTRNEAARLAAGSDA